eukprot:GHVP01021291.1.p1 GENE.GHVP01021291.1~~GHVP01021291.1.p1  ORF type:complete len:499 (-),score=42.61 GHVP01021291.1:1004-2500(-)
MDGQDGLKNTIEEFISSEGRYLHGIEFIRSFFMDRMRTLIDPYHFKVIFMNIETIITTTQLLYSDIHNVSSLEIILEIFNNRFPLLICYENYFLSYKESIKQLNHLLITNKSLSLFLKSSDKLKETNNKDLFNYLLLPIQRLPRYPLLLKQMLNYSNNYYKLNIINNINLVENILKNINNNIKYMENRLKLINIINNINKKYKINHELNIKYNLINNDKRLLIKVIDGCTLWDETTRDRDMNTDIVRGTRDEAAPNDKDMNTDIVRGIRDETAHNDKTCNTTRNNKIQNKTSATLLLCNDIIIIITNNIHTILEIPTTTLTLRSTNQCTIHDHTKRARHIQSTPTVIRELLYTFDTIKIDLKTAIAIRPLNKPTNTLSINIIKGMNLILDDINLELRPYTVIQFQEQLIKSRIKEGENPEWNEELTFFINELEGIIRLSVYDYKEWNSPIFLGVCELDIAILEYYGYDITEEIHLLLDYVPKGSIVIRLKLNDINKGV